MVDIQKIQTFLCAAETSSLSEAAKQLHLTQPAVSHQIKLLEQELGTKLFVRSSIGLKMTDSGQLLIPWARRLLHDMDDLKDMMSSTEEVFAGEPERTALRLLEGEAHLGIISKEANDKGVESQEFFRDKIELVVPANHRWAKKSSIEPAELVSEPFLLREEASGTRWVMLTELSKFDISLEDLNVFLEIGSAEGIMEAIANGYGISFVSEVASKNLRELGRAVSVPVDGLDIRRTIYMARKRISTPHRPRDVFWSFIHAPENSDLLLKE
jgi:DNA-binding transcriptional LysR family regulator